MVPCGTRKGKKLVNIGKFFTKVLCCVFACVLFITPAMAVPSHTSNTFPNNELMQPDYTYTNQANYANMGVYSDSVDANPEYETVTYTCSDGQYLPAGATACATCPTGGTCPGGTFLYNNGVDQGYYKFSVTTTSSTTVLNFSMSARGTFYVDCGDNGVLSDNAGTTTVDGKVITRSNTTAVTYTCTWASAGAHTVRFGGTGTGYSTDEYTAAVAFFVGADDTASGTNARKIASVSGSLYSLLPPTGSSNGQIPRFYQTFRQTSLTSIPSTLFNGYTNATKRMFMQTFFDCRQLTSVPETLFSSFTTGATVCFNQYLRVVYLYNLFRQIYLQHLREGMVTCLIRHLLHLD